MRCANDVNASLVDKQRTTAATPAAHTDRACFLHCVDESTPAPPHRVDHGNKNKDNHNERQATARAISDGAADLQHPEDLLLAIINHDTHSKQQDEKHPRTKEPATGKRTSPAVP